MLRTIALLLSLIGVSAAHATSTINPAVPADNSKLVSAVVRNNFAAAFNDVNNILGKFARSTAPTNQTALQDWVDTSTSPNYKFKLWNPTTSSWVQWAFLNITTGAFSIVGSAGSFAATPPITVSFPAGVTTYALSIDSNFAVSGGNLALASVANAHLIANCSGGAAEPGNCAWSTFADQAIGASNGMLPYRTGGSWSNISTGTSGATIPLNSTANVFSATQSIITNLGVIPAADTGALLSLANVDGTVSRIELTSAGANAVVSGRTALGTIATPLTLTSGTLMSSFNAHGYDGTSWATTASGAFRVYAEGTWSNTSHPTETCEAVTPSASVTMTDQWCIHATGGATLGTPTGGDQGAGKINAAGLYVNGVAVSAGSVVNAGTINQLAWYAGTGSAVSGLATANNGVLVTSAGGVPSISSTLPSGIAAANMTLTTPSLGVATATSIAIGGCTIGASSFCAAVTSLGQTVIATGAAPLFAVGANGVSNPAFSIGQSGTPVTGINVQANSAGSGLALSVISSGTNENMTIDAKGSGTVTVNATGTGLIALARSITVAGTETITSSSASALTIGLNGATNPAFTVDASTASQAAGLKVKGDVTAGTVAISATDSGANTTLSIDSKGSGAIIIAGTSTGGVTISRALTLGTALTFANGGTSDSGTASTTYTPTIGCAGGGTLTTFTANGRWKQILGKYYYVQIDLLLTNVGSCAGPITATLPNSSTLAYNQVLIGRDNGNTGKAVLGNMLTSSNTVVRLSFYDNTSVVTNANELVVSGVFEAQ